MPTPPPIGPSNNYGQGPNVPPANPAGPLYGQTPSTIANAAATAASNAVSGALGKLSACGQNGSQGWLPDTVCSGTFWKDLGLILAGGLLIVFGAALLLFGPGEKVATTGMA